MWNIERSKPRPAKRKRFQPRFFRSMWNIEQKPSEKLKLSMAFIAQCDSYFRLMTVRCFLLPGDTVRNGGYKETRFSVKGSVSERILQNLNWFWRILQWNVDFVNEVNVKYWAKAIGKAWTLPMAFLLNVKYPANAGCEIFALRRMW